MGAFEHYGNGKIKLYGGGGGGIPIVSDIVNVVSDTFDKADNWTEQVGEDLAKIDPGPAIGDIGESFDKEVLQQVDVGTVATVAAIATQQYYLIPYISAANTAIKGGSPIQIATSFGISYAGGQFAPGISEAAGGGFGGAVAAGATVGAASGAAQTVAAGGDFEDVLKNAGKGAVVGGVTGGVSQGVSQGYDAFKSELGFGQPSLQPSLADAEFAAAQAESLRTQPGGVSDAQMADTLSREGIDKFAAQDIATLTNQNIGQEAVVQNLAASYAPGEIYKPTAVDTGLEKAGKKLASKVITSTILDEVFPTPIYDPSMYGMYGQKRNAGDTGIDYGNTGDGSDLMGTTNVDLTAVNPSQYDLKKFVNAAGDSRLIPFKDNKPESPIPAGYTEAETIGKAEGGLIGNNSTTMVKYSNKPLMGPRKTVKKPKEKKATAGKGLAVRKT
jgi:hypothetical protein